MGFFDIFRSKNKPLAADTTQPKVPKGQVTTPVYLGKARGANLTNSITSITSLSLSDHVRSGTMEDTIKKLVLSSPDLSNAVETKIKTTIPGNYTAIAYDPLGQIDVEATKLLNQIIMKWEVSTYDYTKFTRSTDLRTFSSSLLFDSCRYGAMCGELVLDNMRLPSYPSAISSKLITWKDATPSSYPVYNKKIDLNFPTIFYSSSIQDNETAYSDSPLMAAIQVCMWDAEFVESLRRAAIKNMLQRLTITINTEEFIKTLPAEAQADKAKLKAAMDATVADLTTQFANLSPEDALVYFDVMEAGTIQDANRSEDRSMQVLHDIINGKVSAGAKILPSMIGRGVSSNSASTESALFLKSISSLQLELNILLSRMFTLAIKLHGHDAYAWFAYEEVNLRPPLELESFKAIRQSSVLQQLSLGMLKDEEACIMLTGNLPPDGYKPLSGTMFMNVSPNTGSGNDYSNTSVSSSGKPNSTQAQKDGEAEKKGVKSS